MKVAYIVTWYPKITETFVVFEALGLAEHGVEASIYPIRRSKETVQHSGAERIADRVFAGPLIGFGVAADNAVLFARRPRRYVRGLWRALRSCVGSLKHFAGAVAFLPRAASIARRLERNRTDHIHAHFAHHPTLCAWFASELTGIPFSFVGHGSDVHVDRTGLGDKLAHCAFALTVSRFNREVMLEGVDPEHHDKLRVHHCGTSTAQFSPSEAKTGSRFDIVCVASLRTVKGHEHLLRAAALLASRGVHFACKLIGEGPEEERLRRLARALGIEQRIHFLGSLPRDLVIEELRRADAGVLTSAPDAEGRKEGIPVALMEAMACGLPVVSSDMSGIPELVRDGVDGFLTPPADSTAIAAALERLASDVALRQRMGASGRERVCAEFEESTQLAKLAEILRTGGGARETASESHGR